MSSSAIRNAAFNARRTYTIGDQPEAKRPDRGSDKRLDVASSDTSSSIALEPHWQASIESATD